MKGSSVKLPLLIVLMIVAIVVGTMYYSTLAEGGEEKVVVLSSRNTVSLNMPIQGNTARDVEQSLLNISSQSGKGRTIYLVLNSPGGSIDDGRHIIDVAKSLPQRVDTISMFSASMSFIISQYLGTRYVLEDSTLMSHRATAEGMGGQVPGSLISRVMALFFSITELEKTIAERAHMPLDEYRKITANELWLTGTAAVQSGFADRVVKVRCDKSLNGPGAIQELDLGFVTAKVQFHKCPLITAPIAVTIDSPTASWAAKEQERAFMESIYDRRLYVRNHGDTLIIK